MNGSPMVIYLGVERLGEHSHKNGKTTNNRGLHLLLLSYVEVEEKRATGEAGDGDSKWGTNSHRLPDLDTDTTRGDARQTEDMKLENK